MGEMEVEHESIEEDKLISSAKDVSFRKSLHCVLNFCTCEKIVLKQLFDFAGKDDVINNLTKSLLKMIDSNKFIKTRTRDSNNSKSTTFFDDGIGGAVNVSII